MESKMKISQAGILVLIAFTVLIGAGCGKILARKDLVDGAQAYKDRKFDEAERLFRSASERDPEQNIAQLFLARTLHSQYASNRTMTDKAEEAIVEYRKTIEVYKKAVNENSSLLAGERSPCSYSDFEVRKMEGDRKSAVESFKILGDSYKAVANLLDSLQRPEERIQWLTQWSEDETLPACLRAEAYTSLAARENTCANDITENPAVKKTVQRDGKPAFEFIKPENEAEYQSLRQCVERGTGLIRKAAELDPNSDSIWSYMTSLLVQNMRLAEMDKRTEDREKFKNEADQAKERFTELAKIKKERLDAEEAARKAEEEAANPQ
jgi:tetratricopeptide (TPR) repeat protein